MLDKILKIIYNTLTLNKSATKGELTMPVTTNYTQDQESKMVALYTEASTDADRKEVVSQLASEMGKSTRSIVAKLSSLKVYQKAEKVTKNGKAIVTKAQLVEQIAKAIDLDAEQISSLDKATKLALEKLLSAVS